MQNVTKGAEMESWGVGSWVTGMCGRNGQCQFWVSMGMVESIVVLRVFYRCEFWALTAKEQVDMLEIKYLRLTCVVVYHVRSDNVGLKFGSKHRMTEKANQGVLKWYDWTHNEVKSNKGKPRGSTCQK